MTHRSSLALTLVLACAALASGCPRPVTQEPLDASAGTIPCAPGCRDNELCRDGLCVLRTCERVRCLAGSACVRGRCYPTACASGDCAPGEVCDGLKCVEAACAEVVCAFGRCVDGGCPSCSQLEYFEPDAGRCTRKKAPGEACSAATECSGGFCVGGSCCDRPCDAQCEQCSTGACEVRVALDPGGPPACFPGRCNGRGRQCDTVCTGDGDCAQGAFCLDRQCVPVLALGATCDRKAMCGSGFCANGVCCGQACTEACSSCLATGADAGSVPAGTCHGLPNSYSYSSCGVYRCDPNVIGCPTRCTVDTQCAPGFFCDGAACVPVRPLAAVCSRNGECGSGNCRDGKCCATGCTGACRRCDAAGSCADLPNGTLDAGCGDGGVCSSGLCCDSACTGECERCDLPGRVGMCSGVSGPLYTCNAYFICQGDAGCGTTCASHRDCSREGYCDGDTCIERCDPVACAAQNPNYCCDTNNVCTQPPFGQLCEGI